MSPEQTGCWRAVRSRGPRAGSRPAGRRGPGARARGWASTPPSWSRPERQGGIEALAGPGTPLTVVTEPTGTATAAAFAHSAVLAGRPGNAAALAEAGRLFGRRTCRKGPGTHSLIATGTRAPRPAGSPTMCCTAFGRPCGRPTSRTGRSRTGCSSTNSRAPWTAPSVRRAARTGGRGSRTPPSGRRPGGRTEAETRTRTGTPGRAPSTVTGCPSPRTRRADADSGPVAGRSSASAARAGCAAPREYEGPWVMTSRTGCRCSCECGEARECGEACE